MSDDISIPSPTYRVPRHSRGMDPGTRKLALIAAGIGGFLIAVGGGWHMLSHHHGGVPIVQADPGPMRVKPSNPGGLQVAGANNDIFSGGSDTADAKLAPPPQTPDPQALQAMEAPPEPVAPPPAASQPAAAIAPPTQPAAGPAAAPPPAPGQPAREAPVAPVQQTPVARSEAPVPPAHTADKPAATAASRPAAGGKDVQVQLAALSSEEAAHQEWDRLMRRWPDLLRGHQPSFSQIDRDGHVFWRVRASGFDGVSDASVFCERVRAKGGGCSVADF
ncbi:MAG TPA: SPOR domain-containing protein [Acetobacteraceae bacterium]|nr:SPOR domain-containing protein [Acetobacteraceae bacterium]